MFVMSFLILFEERKFRVFQIIPLTVIQWHALHFWFVPNIYLLSSVLGHHLVSFLTFVNPLVDTKIPPLFYTLPGTSCPISNLYFNLLTPSVLQLVSSPYPLSFVSLIDSFSVKGIKRLLFQKPSLTLSGTPYVLLESLSKPPVYGKPHLPDFSGFRTYCTFVSRIRFSHFSGWSDPVLQVFHPYLGLLGTYYSNPREYLKRSLRWKKLAFHSGILKDSTDKPLFMVLLV